jgi:hypothetical protein
MAGRAGLARPEQDKETRSSSNSVGLCGHTRHLAYKPRREGWKEFQSTHTAQSSSGLSGASRDFRDTVGQEYFPDNTGSASRATDKDELPAFWAHSKSNKRDCTIA